LVHTGQHFDASMSDVFFSELGIPAPGHHLGIGGLSHGAMTGRMLEALEQAMLEEKPDRVLVYGDTNSTLAGALAAAKLKIAVAHVEAGLRSFNRSMPEEINRVATDHLSSLLFAPTATAVENLRREGIEGAAVVRTGDVMYDAALAFGDIAGKRSTVLAAHGLAPKSYLLATVHRAENTDEPARLRVLFQGLADASAQCPVVLPLHPRTRKLIDGLGLRLPATLRMIEPVGFFDMLVLERHARTIITDSGGVQKEAYFHRVPCVTLRDETEWVELIEAGANRLAPPLDAAALTRAIEAAQQTPQGAFDGALYGKGDAAQTIAASLER
ncbi:MAG: non-hydrolyzing UDP-N-acetylglucosamine 2-epimerase, partial [Burkholderiales bacterium]